MQLSIVAFMGNQNQNIYFAHSPLPARRLSCCQLNSSVKSKLTNLLILPFLPELLPWHLAMFGFS